VIRRLGALAALALLVTLTGCSPAPESSSAKVAPATARPPEDLADLLDAGTLSLVRATGNGNSSGASVDGVIRNHSQRKVSIATVMARPVFFTNDGPGQNMIGSIVLGAGGGYVSDGTHSFVPIAPDEQASVVFIAYCVDFEKPNPTASEHFSADDAPLELARTMHRIAAYVRANPEEDITVSAQVAVWLNQGVEASTIREKFPFSRDDEALARSFLSR
jgi:hypothetical protein